LSIAVSHQSINPHKRPSSGVAPMSRSIEVMRFAGGIIMVFGA
jgi:hypothetical protein